jgi:uncharacterized protein DUF2461
LIAMPEVFFHRARLRFLADLPRQNDRAWFAANKARYERTSPGQIAWQSHDAVGKPWIMSSGPPLP